MLDQPPIDPLIVREAYNARREIWEGEDPWHSYTHRRLSEAVGRIRNKIDLDQCRVLNVGSAGNSYGISSKHHFYLDIAEALLPRTGSSVGGTAEKLPFRTASFDAVLCIGSVINYCDALPVCREAARVLKPGGWLILEFESSESGEYLFRPEFGNMAAFVITTYFNQPERIWLYSPKYIKEILSNEGLNIISDEGFHAITALIFRLFGNINKAMQFDKLDRASFIGRSLRRFSCNRIFLAQKRSQN